MFWRRAAYDNLASRLDRLTETLDRNHTEFLQWFKLLIGGPKG